MTFQVEITTVAEAQIENAYRWYRANNPEFGDRWFREIMNAIATLQEKPRRCSLAVEHEIFSEEVRQLLHGKSKNVYRILFTAPFGLKSEVRSQRSEVNSPKFGLKPRL